MNWKFWASEAPPSEDTSVQESQPQSDGPGTYRVTLADGRFIVVNAGNRAQAIAQARHEETSRIYRAAASSHPQQYSVSEPVGLEKIKG